MDDPVTTAFRLMRFCSHCGNRLVHVKAMANDTKHCSQCGNQLTLYPACIEYGDMAMVFDPDHSNRA